MSTRKLVDSDEEQRVLEEVLEASKPPLAAAEEGAGLHYLLFTPFRYPPLRRGSRFGTRLERGIWYGARTLRTCLSEVAFYRLLFLEGTEADLAPLIVDLTAFRARVRTRRGVDLTRPPFDAFSERLASPSDYRETQELGAATRTEGVEVLVFRSARDPHGGANVAVFSPSAFATKSPTTAQTWLCVTSPEAVELSRKDLVAPRRALRFVRSEFEVDGRLPRASP